MAAIDNVHGYNIAYIVCVPYTGAENERRVKNREGQRTPRAALLLFGGSSRSRGPFILHFRSFPTVPSTLRRRIKSVVAAATFRHWFILPSRPVIRRRINFRARVRIRVVD